MVGSSLGWFHRKSECTKVSNRYLKNFEKKYLPFESTFSIEFKIGLGFKIDYEVLEKFPWARPKIFGLFSKIDMKVEKLTKIDDFVKNSYHVPKNFVFRRSTFLITLQNNDFSVKVRIIECIF